MPTFDAGSIHSSLTLDRSDFIRGLEQSKKDAEEFAKKKYRADVGISDQRKTSAQLDALQRRLDKLSKSRSKAQVQVDTGTGVARLKVIQDQLDKLDRTKSRPDVDLGGIVKTQAELKAMSAKLDEIGRTRKTATVRVDTKQAEAGLGRLMDGLIALAPAGVPILGALGGAAGAMGAAFVTAGVGVAGFAGITAAAIAQANKDAKALKTANTGAASSSKALQSAQAAVAAAQARANTTTGASTSSTQSLARARLTLAQAEKRLDAAATPAAAQSARLSVQRAQLGVSQAQSRVSTAGASSAASHAKATASLSAAQQRLADAQKKNAAAQKTLNDATAAYTPAEQKLTASVEKIKNSFHGFVSDEIPAISGTLAGFFPLMQDGFRIATPIIGGTSKALQGLEKDAHTSLNTAFYKEFFGYLGDQAGPTVTTLGHDFGNITTGIFGVARAFGPLQVQLEGGLERLTRKFSNFGQGATSNSGLLDFISYVEREGPQVVTVVGQLGSTLADVARAAAPIGAAELKIITNTLQMVDAAAKAHPELVQVGVALLTINKTAKVFKLAGVVSSLDRLAGLGATAAGGTLKVASAVGKLGKVEGGVAAASTLGGIAGGFAKTGTTAKDAETGVGKVATKLPGLTRLAKGAGGVVAGLGGAFGVTGLAAGALGLGIIGAAGGLTYLGIKLATAKSGFDGYYGSLVKQYQATGNNVKGYQNLSSALADQQAKAKDAESAVHAYIDNQGRFAAVNGTSKESVNQLRDSLNEARNKLGDADKASKITSDRLHTLRSSADQVASQFGITRTQALHLADRLNIDLSKGLTGSSAATKKARDRLAAYNQEVALSHSPQQQIALDLKKVGDNSYTAADQVGGLTDALNILSGKNIDASQAEDDFQRALRNINTTAKNGTRTLKGYSDGALANRDAIRAAGKQADQHVISLQNQGASADRVRKAMINDRTALLNQATATFGSRDAAKAFLKQLGLLPSQAKDAQDAVQKMTDDINKRISHLSSKDILIRARGSWSDAAPAAGAHDLRKPIATSQADGGLIRGPGGPRGDQIPAWLSDTEYVQPAHVVAREGVEKMDALRAGKATITPVAGFAAGGQVSLHAKTSLGNLNTAPQAWYSSHLDKFAQSVAKAARQQQASAGGGTGDMSAHGASAAAAQAYARSILGQFGWGPDQMPPLIQLWNGESGWNNLAQNPTSSAMGVAQFLDSTWAGKRYPKTTNYRHQVWDGEEYIAGSYGNPAAALAAWLGRSPHWYRNGTTGAAPGPAVVGEDGPEVVWMRGGEQVASNRDVRRFGMLPGYASGTLDFSQLQRDLERLLRGLGGGTSATGITSTGTALTGRVTGGLGDVIARNDQLIKEAKAQLAQLTKDQSTELAKYAKERAKDLEKIRKADEVLNDKQSTKTMRRNANDNIREADKDLSTIAKQRDTVLARIAKQRADLVDKIAGAQSRKDLASARESALVKYIRDENGQLSALGRQRDGIVAKIQAAQQNSASVRSATSDFAGITGIGFSNAAGLNSGLQAKLASINSFTADITKLSAMGLNKDILQQLINEGPGNGGVQAAQLVVATRKQIQAINRSQTQINQAGGRLGTIANNAVLGGNAAKGFVAGLQAQEGALEREMDRLARRFSQGIRITIAGNVAHRAAGGPLAAGQMSVVGEHGPEIAAFSTPVRIYSNRQSTAMGSIDYKRLAAEIGAVLPKGPLIGTMNVNDNVDAQLAIQRVAFATQSSGLA